MRRRRRRWNRLIVSGLSLRVVVAEVLAGLDALLEQRELVVGREDLELDLRERLVVDVELGVDGLIPFVERVRLCGRRRRSGDSDLKLGRELAVGGYARHLPQHVQLVVSLLHECRRVRFN